MIKGIRELIQRELASLMASVVHPTAAPTHPTIDNESLSPASFAVAALAPAPIINLPSANDHAT